MTWVMIGGPLEAALADGRAREQVAGPPRGTPDSGLIDAAAARRRRAAAGSVREAARR
jgi:hypothetical protein